MDKITIEPFVFDQQRIRYWGAVCGYCGDKPGMPVCFLAGRMDKLTVEEKADVIEHVMEQVGDVPRTPQTRKAFDVIDDRRNSRGE